MHINLGYGNSAVFQESNSAKQPEDSSFDNKIERKKMEKIIYTALGVLVILAVFITLLDGWEKVKNRYNDFKEKNPNIVLDTLGSMVIVTVIAVTIMFLDTTSVVFLGIIAVSSLMLLGIYGRVFVQIPQNHVAGIFRSGIRVKYVVATEEDLKKLSEEVTIAGVVIENKAIADGKYRVEIATWIPILTSLFNVRIYSLNPFATIRPVEIQKNYWKTRGELAAEEAAKTATNPDRRSSVVDKIRLATTTSYERFLRIDSVVIGYDATIELRGNMKVNYDRQTNVRAWNLDEIYLTQNARYSGYVDETIRAAHMAVLNTLAYNKDETTPDGKTVTHKNFQDINLSEKENSHFNEAIRECISGNFGSIILTTAINDWELSDESQAIVDAVNRATASEHDRKAAENKAIGDAAPLREQGLAAAAGQGALLEKLKEMASTPEGRVAIAAHQNQITSANFALNRGTLVFGTTVSPVIPLPVIEEKTPPTTPPTTP